jgi:hypothetical protein
MPKYFVSIPGFAQRAHLDVKGLVPLGGQGGWASDACDAFRKYLAIWEPQIPIYYAWRCPGASTISLDEYNQELVYNKALGVWEKGDIVEIPHERNVSRAKDSQMASNLFVSIGVDVVYEIMTGPNDSYKFEQIWDVLVTQGLGIYNQ